MNPDEDGPGGLASRSIMPMLLLQVPGFNPPELGLFRASSLGSNPR
jgi:hypothetical protein